MIYFPADIILLMTKKRHLFSAASLFEKLTVGSSFSPLSARLLSLTNLAGGGERTSFGGGYRSSINNKATYLSPHLGVAVLPAGSLLATPTYQSGHGGHTHHSMMRTRSPAHLAGKYRGPQGDDPLRVF